MSETMREMSFDEEFAILQEEKERLFSQELAGCEPPFANCVVRRALRCIWKLNSRKVQNDWISVEERLPDTIKGFCSNKVLIAQGVKDKQISFGWLRCGIWVNSDMNPFAKQDLITHWMPLPDKPIN